MKDSFSRRRSGSDEPHLAADDDVLVARAQAGDRVALDALTAKYYPRIYAFALSIMLRADDAEDVTQETFLRVVRTLASYQARGQFRSWIYRIAANLCYDHRRKNRKHQLVDPEVTHQVAAPTDLQSEKATEVATIAALARLPQKYREVMTLRCLEDLSPMDIAAVLGRPVNLVRVQLWRARALLMRDLADWLE